MKRIVEPNKAVMQLIGAQTVDAAQCYRPISFCVLTDTDGKRLAYNTLTGELLEPDDAEAAQLARSVIPASEVNAALVEKLFLVPVPHDDMQLSDELRLLVSDFQRQDSLSGYTIFTTMDCNARCFYCYEMGRPRTPMTAQTARDTVDFILRTRGGNKVSLHWFGGEPLYNAEVIDIICRGLQDAGVPYQSHMVSNGYLFDDAVIAKAKALWNLTGVQITLDGTEDVYNKAKAFIYKDGRSAFRVVTDNIERLLDAGIRVTVRMNMGDHNKDDLYRLVDWLGERFAEKSGFSVYPHLLFDTERDQHDPHFAETRARRAKELCDFEGYCVSRGLLAYKKLTNGVRISACMMDSPQAVTILPDGHLGKCEHFSEDHFVGDIYTGITNTAQIEAFKERANSRELCGGCPAYPICVKLKSCPDESYFVCDAAKRLIEETTLRRRVEATWRAAKKKAAEKSAE